MSRAGAHGGSQTATSTDIPQQGRTVGRLVLRPDETSIAQAGSSRQPARPRVRWTTGTVDNEGLGRKSSKICCIYHKPRNFDESSSEDDSDDSNAENSPCRHHEHERTRTSQSQGETSLSESSGDEGQKRRTPEGRDGGAGSKGKGKARAASPNAYERAR
ncbi:Type 1 phosphatases regulator ypi1 [Savitreella phatthalungensis]